VRERGRGDQRDRLHEVGADELGPASTGRKSIRQMMMIGQIRPT
jgi:hypothetical protein